MNGTLPVWHTSQTVFSKSTHSYFRAVYRFIFAVSLCLLLTGEGTSDTFSDSDSELRATLAGTTAGGRELLPDIIVDESYLYDWDVTTTIEPGKTHLRLSNGTANIGNGPLHLFGVEPGATDSTQDVMQRVYLDDDSYYDRLAGRFIYHPEHGHIHFEDWAIYRLREVVDSNGVGDLIAEGSKTSFCILDLGVYDNTLPGFDPNGSFFSCGSQTQGLSVGWIDVYSLGLPGQNIDITGIPDGMYWLESEVDPNDDVLEADETNNVTRILINLGGGGFLPDAYEPNDNGPEVAARPAGKANSPNLGPCGPLKVVSGLSIHAPGNDDFFRFYMNHTGTFNDSVRIDFNHGAGDLDMQLLNSNLTVLSQSESTSNHETIELFGQTQGWYYVRVFGWNDATNPVYSLTIDPPSNSSPFVSVTNPPAGDTSLIHGFDTYQVEWSFSDPEDDDCWVSVYVNTTPQLDGNEFLLPTSVATEADQSFYVVNTAYLDHFTYYVYCEITDGGTKTGDWSEGTMTITEPPAVESVAGHVYDTLGSPIDGVEIMVVGHMHADTTDNEGFYSIHSHDPGQYDISFAHPYYRDTVVTGISVIPLQTTQLDVVMEPDCSGASGPEGPCCCTCPMRGNLDGDAQCDIGLGDLTVMIDHLFVSLADLDCWMSGNLDLSEPEGAGSVTLSDMTVLIDHLFINLTPLPSCP